MPQSELDKKIREWLATEEPSNVLELVQTQYQKDKIGNSVLALLFLAYIDVTGWEDKDNGISPVVLMEDLCKVNIFFRPTNGNQWARSNTGEIGSKYIINREVKNGQTYSIQLVGFNKKIKGKRTIRKNIYEVVSKQRCVVLDTSSQIEVDHKNGRYDDETALNLETQSIDDFQPLHKTVNDAKRAHCKKCIESHKRYDATRLGYKEGWVYGDEEDAICKGCYWYDPKEFNKEISKNFIKRCLKMKLEKLYIPVINKETVLDEAIEEIQNCIRKNKDKVDYFNDINIDCDTITIKNNNLELSKNGTIHVKVESRKTEISIVLEGVETFKAEQILTDIKREIDNEAYSISIHRVGQDYPGNKPINTLYSDIIIEYNKK